MKKTYIAPQTDITKLSLKGSVLDTDPDPGLIGGSTDTDEGGSNSVKFDDADIETEIISSPNLWDE